MNSRQLFVLGFGFLAGVALSAPACIVDNPDHCTNGGGDSYCAKQGHDRAYCSDNSCVTPTEDGCVDEVPTGCWICNGKDGDNSDCEEMADGDGDGDQTGDGDGDQPGDGDGEQTGDGDGDTSPECVSSDECDGDQPLCDDGSCVACGDASMASCSLEYPATPVCNDGSGACVECSVQNTSACSENEPICKGGVCGPCDEHAQCPDSACNLSSGACMPVDRVWWVNQAVAVSGDGTMGSPFKTIAEALAQVANGEEGTVIVATPTAHTEQMQILAGRTVAVLGDSDGASITFPDGTVAIVNATAKLFAGKLRLSQGTTGLSCSGGQFWFHDGKISGNMGVGAGRGVSLDACVAAIFRSEIINNSGGGIHANNGGSLHIENSVVGGDNPDQTMLSTGTTAVTVVYSTLAASFNGTALSCGNGGVMVDVRNSLIVSRDANISEVTGCDSAIVESSALEAPFGDNVALGQMNVQWFINFNLGDMRLSGTAPSAIADAAVWLEGDPTTDIDGDLRPTVDGTPDYAGADVP